ncbi:AbrB/MazE/SpoVT family DNA-binding domain-containing protein [Peptacetobacter sp. AB845]|uniref:AbrB/MazE/SpoVT family DNA-binding domain-containing protein n=1 Tax=Peptacetobacter sp. AB845 TaxID=3388429 RepID=UPI0039C9E29C
MKTLLVSKWGNSQGIRLSKEILNQLGWGENEEVEVDIQDGKLSLKPVIKESRRPNVIPIEELFKDYDMSDYEPSEIYWGESVGQEVIEYED